MWVGLGLLTAVLIAQTMGGQKKIGDTLTPPDSSPPQTSAAPAAEDPAQETAEPTPDSSSSYATETPAAETARPFSPSQPTNARENREWTGQSITVARGDTISRIVLKAYGSYNVLALDLIKEFNPGLEDLNRIIIGTQVWLPDLTRGTLLRKQEDNSYHLVIGSFHSEAEARKIAQKAQRRVRGSRPNGENQAEPLIPGAIHFALLHRAQSTQPLEHRGGRPRVAPNPGATALRQHARQVSRDAAASDC